MNQRVMVSNAVAATMYSFNPFGQRSGTIDASLALQREQVYWGGKPMAMVVQSGTPVIRYQFQTYNGSERLQDSLGGGGLTSDYSWNPWGDSQHVDAGTDEDPYHYAMLDGDADGTQHAQFRNYNPKTAQWLSPDPYIGSYVPQDPQSLNRYAYTGNNPLTFVDPSGLVTLAGYTYFSGGCLTYHQNEYYDSGGVLHAPYDITLYCISTGFLSSLMPSAVPPTGSRAGTTAPNNGTPKPAPSPTPQQPPKQPWYCGAGNSWSHPFTAPTGRQWGLWSVSDAAVATYSTKVTGGKPNPVSEVFTAASLLEGWGWAACN